MFGAASKILAALAVLGFAYACTPGSFSGDGRGAVPLSQSAKSQLSRMGSSPSAPMFIRIYKRESELEVWKKTASGGYQLFDTYAICAWSGELGPKIYEGDRQTPEGFYTITPGLMNPNSEFHLAINLGFPNSYDRSLGRNGSNIMIHGDCSSRGCYAMTNEQIEEIYALVRETFAGGNRSVQAQVYPFRMTAENFAEYQGNRNMSFWRNLKLGYDTHQVTGEPPVWDVCGSAYTFDTASACGASTLSDTQRTRLASIQTADATALRDAVAAREERTRLAALEAARLAEEAATQAQRQAQAEVASAERQQAVSGFTGQIGTFFSGLFGGSRAPVNDPAAPVPPPRPARYS